MLGTWTYMQACTYVTSHDTRLTRQGIKLREKERKAGEWKKRGEFASSVAIGLLCPSCGKYQVLAKNTWYIVYKILDFIWIQFLQISLKTFFFSGWNKFMYYFFTPITYYVPTIHAYPFFPHHQTVSRLRPCHETTADDGGGGRKRETEIERRGRDRRHRGIVQWPSSSSSVLLPPSRRAL